MEKKKNKKSFYVVFGYLLILLGIGLPLYGFLNMSLANLNEDKEYRAYLEENTETSQEEEKGIEEYNSKIHENYIVDPFDNLDYKAEYKFYRDHPDKVFAYISIPKLDLKKPVYLDASYDHLEKGVAHVDGTALPVGGKGRRSVIAGHRGWYKDLVFLYLDRLESGDEIILNKDGHELTYLVSDKEVIYQDEWEKLSPRSNEDMLTLLTCEPLAPPRNQRLLVNAIRKEDESIGEEAQASGPVQEASEDRQEIEEKKADKETKDAAAKVDSKVKSLNLGLYAISLILSLAFIFVLYRFISYLLRK